MALVEIDEGAATARLREVAAVGKAALETRMRRIAELDGQARAAFERDEAELVAAKERAAKATVAAEPAPKSTPKRTLSLGADEFKEAREARQAKPAPKAQDRPARGNGDDDLSGRTWLR